MFYLTWCIIWAAVWLAFFLLAKKRRKQMLIMSLIFGFAGPIGESIHIRDWWQPETITGTAVGIEDFLIGFFIGGIASVAYGIIAAKKPSKEPKALSFIGLIVLMTLVFFGLYVAGMHTFYASTLMMAGFTVFMVIKRRDLIAHSVAGGFIMLALGTLIYMLMHLLYPGFVQQYWYLPDAWFSYLLLGLPAAEYIWFFMAGAFISPLYDFLSK